MKEHIQAYILYFVTWVILYLIIKQFTTSDNAVSIVSSIVICSVIFYGFFSIRKNIRLLKILPSNQDIPQKLIINGIEFNLTVRKIAYLKLIYWVGLYLLILFLAYETLIAAPQRKIDNLKNNLSYCYSINIHFEYSKMNEKLL